MGRCRINRYICIYRYPINPARDFGARLFALCIYGGQAFRWAPFQEKNKKIPFRADNYWFWVPIVGPTVGGIVGALLYNFLFDFHNPKDPPRKSISYDEEDHKEPITDNQF